MPSSRHTSSTWPLLAPPEKFHFSAHPAGMTADAPSWKTSESMRRTSWSRCSGVSFASLSAASTTGMPAPSRCSVTPMSFSNVGMTAPAMYWTARKALRPAQLLPCRSQM